MEHAYQNPDLAVDKRVVDLLRKMSVTEKIGQLCKMDGFKSYNRNGDNIVINQEFKNKFAEVPIGSMYGLLRADWWTTKNWASGLEPHLMAEGVNHFQQYVIENSRWGIPLIMAEEAPHGLMVLGGTVFPSGLGLGATWDPEIMHKVAGVINAEGSSAGIHTVYGPILDIPHDPRWSRTEEDFSEDPYLTSAMGVAYVKGLQGGHFPVRGRLFSTLKHLAGHGDPEGGHNSATSHLGPIEFRNIQLKPFEDCIRAGACSMMCAYNTIDGIPCAANAELLTQISRKEFGFDGFIVSDRGAIPQLIWQRFAGDDAEASAMALKAGIDTDEGCIDFYANGLHQALQRGLITMDDLDQAVGRVLKLKFSLGLFENPYLKIGNPVEVVGCPAHRAIALDVAQKSLTLLANKNILPLKNITSLAVIGPNADGPMNQLGDYTAPQRDDDIITVRKGIETVAKKRNIRVSYAKGCGIRSLNRGGFQDALQAASAADATILVLGGSSAWGKEIDALDTGAANASMQNDNLESDKESGEGYDRASLRLSGLQLELLRELKTTGKPVVVVLVMGRPLIINEVLELADAVLLAWYPGMMGGQAIADTLFGDYNPAGRLPVSFPRNEGQLPVYYNAHMPRRDYIDLEGTPRLQFGFGLSYTSFDYSVPELVPARACIGDTVKVTVKVTNTGTWDGDEVVQLYLTDRVSSIARPYRELRGVKRLHIKAGESIIVTFQLGNKELGFYGKDLKYVVEPGHFTVAVGGNLDSLKENELELL